jgi:hypothetical protein
MGLVNEALGRTTDNSSYVYLSDGGHFENLAMYEMVKRRCHRIVLVDAGCDPKYAFEDLENAIRKIRTDMGISIVFPDGLPTPRNVAKSGRHIAMGTINYSDVDGKDTDGQIIYIKPVISGDEPLDVLRYYAANRKPKGPFPHQSTADQFFDEAQFESYRMLGYHSVMTGFPDTVGSGSYENGDWPKKGQESDTEIDIEPDQESPSSPGTGSSGGAFGGISDAFQSMGRGALIASAITVGGVVGVTGTVALKDATVALKPGAEVKIRDADMELLKHGVTVTIPLDVFKNVTVPLDPKAAVGIKQEDKDLLEKRLTVNVPPVELKDKKVGLDSRDRVRIDQDDLDALRRIISTVTSTPSLGVLETINNNITNVNRKLDEINPRRNIQPR